MSSDKRVTVSSGSKWEAIAGYSRAVKVGNIIEVAGTTAVDDKGDVVGLNDVEMQTRYVFQKIATSLRELGADLEHVVRTRMYVTNIAEWEAVTKVHGEIFGSIRPVCTLIEVSKLIQSDLLIEIEASAILPVI